MDDLTLSLTSTGTIVAPALLASRHDTDPVRDRVSGGTRQSHLPRICHRVRRRALTPPSLAPRTVRHQRQTLAQVLNEAVKYGTRDEYRALLAAARDHRPGAAVALLFPPGGASPRCSGWPGKT